MKLSKEVYERLANMSYDNIKKSLKQNNKTKKVNYSDYQYKSNKYHNKKIEYNGIKFDSKKEMSYYIKFKLMEKAGEIQNLQRQVKYELQPSFKLNGKTTRAINYYADFTYKTKDGKLHVIDVKGMKTEVYKLKKKIMAYKYGIEIEEL